MGGNKPLSGMKFVIIGKMEKPKQEVTQAVTALGGKIVTKVDKTTAACISSKGKLLAYPALPCPALPCPAIPCHTIPYHTIPYHTIPYHTIPYHTIPYHTIPYHTIPYPTLPYPTLPYPTLPYLIHQSCVSVSAPICSVSLSLPFLARPNLLLILK